MTALLACAACAEPRPRASATPEGAGTSTPASTALSNLPPEVADAYRSARDAVRRRDHLEARRHLRATVDAMPDFTEGWYNLGAAASRLAVESAGRGEDQTALTFFREGVAAKRRADQLIREGKWFIYGPSEQAQVTADLASALEDADEVLANEPALLAALRLHAAREE